ncbi:small GTP-binding protein [Histomonas meleagridis]|uniref:small GTP-binding protein n=1 Tax=Histomonas meleagridis TaxID=135588 RepID=UPI0035599958|nr:small GTP-binding protein [Histomonas meleagridis]KAH0798484.1 small GTP-binding protein [Histomonas meleagridis]
MTEGAIKIVFLGDSGVGKTSIVTKYVSGSIPEMSVPTVGAAFVTKDITFNDKAYQLLIWDTAGQELYRGLAPMYYRSALIAIVVYDVSSSNTFKSVDYWVSELRENTEEKIVIVICGNKVDIEDRQIEETYAMEMAEKYNALYTETSAVTGFGVEKLFQIALSELTKNFPKKVTPQPMKLDANPDEEKKKCC